MKKIEISIDGNEYNDLEHLCKVLRTTPEKMLTNHVRNFIRHYSDKNEHLEMIPATFLSPYGEVECTVLDKKVSKGKTFYRVIVNGDTMDIESKNILFKK